MPAEDMSQLVSERDKSLSICQSIIYGDSIRWDSSFALCAPRYRRMKVALRIQLRECADEIIATKGPSINKVVNLSQRLLAIGKIV